MASADIVTLVMALAEPPGMLDDGQLRDVDRTLLSFMDEHPVTPVYCKKRLAEMGQEYSRGYIQERLARLVEHNHAENLLDTGMYALTDDPRENNGNKE